MNGPSAEVLYGLIDVTWPAAARQSVGPWIIRTGQGGGSRVSAATATGSTLANDITQAETAMRDLGQDPLFMIRDADSALDKNLAAKGYVIKDPVNIFAAPVARLQTTLPPVTVITVWPPLQVQTEIWEAGGIGPARIAIMERAPEPKTTLMARRNDQAAGTVYVAGSNGVAMLHALEVAQAHQRQGLGGQLTKAAANWAQSQGFDWLSLLVTRANGPAQALYASLGMQVVGQYHYRALPT